MVLGVSSIMPMIPALARTFAVSQITASLVITAFTLPGIVCTLLSGLLADRFGRRAVLFPSLCLFALAGTACAFAPNFSTLLALRFLQGIGAAPLGVLNATIIADTWSGKPMAAIIGYNTTVLNICTALYPSLGGILAHFDWRFPFLLPIMTLPVLLMVLKTPLANPGATASCKQYLRDVGRIVHTRRIVGLLCITGVTFVLLYGSLITCFPVLADNTFGASTAAIGGAMAFAAAGTALTSSQLGRLYGTFSPRTLLLCSQVLYMASMVGLITMPSLIWMLLPVMLFGMGQGMNIPNVQSQLLTAASAAQRASVMAANGVLLRLGQSLAPVGFSCIMAHAGIAWGFYAGIALAGVIVVLTLVFVPRRNAA